MAVALHALTMNYDLLSYIKLNIIIIIFNYFIFNYYYNYTKWLRRATGEGFHFKKIQRACEQYL